MVSGKIAEGTTGTARSGGSRRPGRKKRVLLIVLVAVFAIVAVCAIGFFVYTSDYYRADAAALEAVEDSGAYAGDSVTVALKDGKTAFVPESPKAGLVFYPGGLVEASAYAPLMQDLAARGILCVVCPMPFNLAVFGINEADGVEAMFPQVSNWYIGGHSLGGSMAATYADAHAADFKGVVLLASYSTSDLSDDGLRGISLYGSEDGVLNAGKYADNRKNLPAETKELVIEGGNHGQFGSYGDQAGDGDAAISPEAQWAETADAVAAWIESQDR